MSDKIAIKIIELYEKIETLEIGTKNLNDEIIKISAELDFKERLLGTLKGFLIKNDIPLGDNLAETIIKEMNRLINNQPKISIPDLPGSEVDKLINASNAAKDKLVEAFLVENKCLPSDVEICTQIDFDGVSKVWLRKRAK